MKLLLAIAAGRAAAVTDVFLASDRLAASAAVLNSVCDNSDPTQLRFHLLAPTQEEAETLARETETACDGAARSFASTVSRSSSPGAEEPRLSNVVIVVEEPSCGRHERDAKVERSTSTYAVPVARWDRDKRSPACPRTRNSMSRRRPPRHAASTRPSIDPPATRS